MKTTGNLLIDSLKACAAKPNEYPDRLALAIMRNELAAAVTIAREYHLTLVNLDDAIRFMRSHISGAAISAVVEKWRKEKL